MTTQDPVTESIKDSKDTKDYTQEISDIIFAVTACKNIDDKIPLYIQSIVKNYILDIKSKAETFRNKKSKKDAVKDKSITADDVFEVLKQTPEYYGVRRCLILKSEKEKVADISSEKPPDILELDTVQDDTEFIAEDLDLFSYIQTELAKLNDESEEYKIFNIQRLGDLEKASVITEAMDIDDYLEYNKCTRTAFVLEKPSKFTTWLNWKTKPNRKVLTILGWLAGNKVRRMVCEALKKRKNRVGTLQGPFIQTWEIYEKFTPFVFSDFTNQQETLGNLLIRYNDTFTFTQKRKNVYEFIHKHRQNPKKRSLEDSSELESKKKRIKPYYLYQ